VWEKGAAWKWAVKLRIMNLRYLFLFLISLLSPWHVLCVMDNLIVALWVMWWRDSTHPSTAYKSIGAGDQAWFAGEAGCCKCTGAESNVLAAQLHELVEKADKVVEANQKWLEAIARIPGAKLTWSSHPLGMEYITQNQCVGVLIDWI